jgi:Mg2+ and Co2+ transporter CorA
MRLSEKEKLTLDSLPFSFFVGVDVVFSLHEQAAEIFADVRTRHGPVGVAAQTVGGAQIGTKQMDVSLGKTTKRVAARRMST